jgi:site-specific recombinase XerD
MAPGGRIGDALTPESAARIVKGYSQRVGLDPASFAGHSLRLGFCTSAAEAGASVFKVMDVSRHKSVDTLRGLSQAGRIRSGPRRSCLL